MIRSSLIKYKRSKVLLVSLLIILFFTLVTIPLRINMEDNEEGGDDIEEVEVNDKPNKDISVVYYAPFYSGGGYCNEAIGFVLGIYDQMENIKIVQHGDDQNDKFVDSIPNSIWDKLVKMSKKKLDVSKSFVICHSQPFGWVPRGYAADPSPDVWCPTMSVSTEPAYLIGRTMFETDKIPSAWIERLNGFDEIWVPTRFNKETFKNCGVIDEKIKVIGEPVNITFYDPNKQTKLDISKYVPEKHKEKVNRSYKFLSIFKWEPRKGWDVLIRAYLNEFNKDDDVVLFILSSTFYLADKDVIPKELSKFISTHVDKPSNYLPLVVFLPEEIPMSDMPKLYYSADAFVLPSRGEGWGLPFVEAMAMELPVLATNWSGNTEYMTDENSYLIKVEKLIKSPIDKKDWNGKGHRWALADYIHLGELMRRLVNNPEEGRRKGKLARKLMVENYAPEKITEKVLNRLREIKTELNKNIDPTDVNLLKIS